MKKEYITLINCDDADVEITPLEVFFLKDPNKYRIVDDAGCDVDSGKYVGGTPLGLGELGELDVNENSAGEGAHGLQWHELPDVTPNTWSHKHSEDYWYSPTYAGHKGETGYEEKNIYKLILASLDKALPDAKESFREVVADGIAKKITKHMTGE